jgi:hypothetical protein
MPGSDVYGPGSEQRRSRHRLLSRAVAALVVTVAIGLAASPQAFAGASPDAFVDLPTDPIALADPAWNGKKTDDPWGDPHVIARIAELPAGTYTAEQLEKQGVPVPDLPKIEGLPACGSASADAVPLAERAKAFEHMQPYCALPPEAFVYGIGEAPASLAKARAARARASGGGKRKARHLAHHYCPSAPPSAAGCYHWTGTDSNAAGTANDRLYRGINTWFTYNVDPQVVHLGTGPRAFIAQRIMAKHQSVATTLEVGWIERSRWIASDPGTPAPCAQGYGQPPRPCLYATRQTGGDFSPDKYPVTLPQPFCTGCIYINLAIDHLNETAAGVRALWNNGTGWVEVDFHPYLSCRLNNQSTCYVEQMTEAYSNQSGDPHPIWTGGVNGHTRWGMAGLPTGVGTCGPPTGCWIAYDEPHARVTSDSGGAISYRNCTANPVFHSYQFESQWLGQGTTNC